MKALSRIKSIKELKFISYLLPAALLYIVFFLFPVASAFYYSMFNYDGPGRPMTFIWFHNFIELFTDTPVFKTAIWNNVMYTIVVLILQTLISFMLAIILNKNLKGGGFFKTFFFTPVVLSSVAISFTWTFMYDPNIGALNSMLSSIGLGKLTQNWLGDPAIALYSVAFIQVWQYVGFEMIIFIAGLKNIPQELIEAAHVEGANAFQRLWNVTIPLLAPATTVAVVLTTVGCFKVFDMIYIITGGGPAHATEVLAMITYDYAFQYNRMGFASACSVVLLTIIMIIGFSQLIFLRSKEIEQ